VEEQAGVSSVRSSNTFGVRDLIEREVGSFPRWTGDLDPVQRSADKRGVNVLTDAKLCGDLSEKKATNPSHPS